MKYPEQVDNYDVDIFNENFLEVSLGNRQLGEDLQTESDRAKAAEKANADAISAETERATAQETKIDSKYAAEAQAIRALIDAAYASANGYTDTKIADLINGAPSTLDTLGEIAQAMQDNADVVAALDAAIGKKASAAEFDSHVKDKANPHAVTKAQLGLGNVDNTADASKSVNYAGSAGNADTVDGVHFSWSGKTGQPTWLWGCNDGGNSYVWNPLDFNVKYAESAGSAVDQVARDIANGKFGPGWSLHDVPSIELGSSHVPTPFIDFHYGGSTTDYTSRLIESSEGTLEVTGNLQVDGRLMHGNTPVFSLSGSTLTINF